LISRLCKLATAINVNVMQSSIGSTVNFSATSAGFRRILYRTAEVVIFLSAVRRAADYACVVIDAIKGTGTAGDRPNNSFKPIPHQGGA
jgi:hypothetical protein